jgi:phosphoglucosamine mutase
VFIANSLAVKKVEKELGASGRVLLRKSGTEPVIRVMAEASTNEQCRKCVDSIVEIIKKKGYTI